jgi:(p)ppGpp synthase/HD superfamily hydrolase
MLTERIAQALALAVEAHAGQKRKGTSIPYISHPLAVASIALEFGADEDQAIAALLHDAIEDGGKEYAHIIEEQFGDRVLYLVQGCTDGIPDSEGKKTDWYERKTNYLLHLEQAHEDILLVSGADKLHNARAIVFDVKSIGPMVFERFSTKKEGTLWYYEKLADIFDARSVPMAKPIRDTINELMKVSFEN